MAGMVMNMPDGSLFTASSRHVPEVPPFGSFGSDEEGQTKLASWVADKFNALFQMKRGETERLKTCGLFYRGFHYIDPWDNRNNTITNYCFQTVETIWPILTQARPRPEPVPRNFMDATKLKRVSDYAEYKLDSSGFDKIHRMCTRDLLTYGWCVAVIGWDAQGRSIPKYWSPFDYYPDGATEESGLECFALAAPVATRRLQALFPKVADKIRPDNIASPSYQVLVQPDLEMAGVIGGMNSPVIISGTMPSTIMEGGAPAATTGNYGIDTGSFSVFGHTTFLIQLFVRDYTTMTVRYQGQRLIDHPTGQLRIPASVNMDEPCCPSGWRMIPMTASGVLLSLPMPVDPVLGGVPVVIGRDYEIGGRLLGRGELDDVIPLQRGINKSDAMLDRSLDLQANPPVLVSTDSGLSVDKASVEGGEILRIKRGSKMEYLQPQGVAESHFERRALRRQDVQIVSGTPDSLQGQRPVGVEAAAAIRQLTESGSSRARAKGANILEWQALLLQKMIHADIMKSDDLIYFRASDGTNGWLDPSSFDPADFEIRWASQSGDAQGEQDRIDTDKELLQLGVIDPQQLLDDMNYPNRAAILQRMAVRQIQAQQAAQAATAQNGGVPKGGKP
jgi:hypothetical protein